LKESPQATTVTLVRESPMVGLELICFGAPSARRAWLRALAAGPQPGG
jgi:hypothetical protein